MTAAAASVRSRSSVRSDPSCCLLIRGMLRGHGLAEGARTYIQNVLREEIRELSRSEHLYETSEQLRNLTQVLALRLSKAAS